jgi:hypothetical protein
MIKVQFAFVPPGGGETDYTAEFDLPAVPRPGDYVSIRDSKEAAGVCSFIVRRTVIPKYQMPPTTTMAPS